MKTRTFSVVAFAAVSGIAAIAQADPQYTVVNAPPGAELGHPAILSNMYGGTWGASGVHVTNGTHGAMRVMDAGASAGMSIPVAAPELAQDDVWAGNLVSVAVRARYAGDSHIFGWIDDTAAEPAFAPIISTHTLNSPVMLEVSSNFRWALHNTSTGLMFTSAPWSNAGVGSRSAETFDQLVTYHVTGPSGLSEIALFWEDRIGGQSADYDYNDAVITIAAVPAPGAGALAAIGLIGLAGSRRRK
ncbi:MAG: hypothetical protein KF869_03345 [Phycisphaeraceae bacterium]|nr:hypothetical protein [Phycisphaeraceae bacterium]